MRHANVPGPAKRFHALIPTLLILPAVALGIIAMILSGVSPVLWGQQATAFAVFALLARPLRRAVGRLPATLLSALLLLLLTATLFGEAVGGARRWLDLGVFNVNAAMLVLPALAVTLFRREHPFAALLIAAAVLCLQPDLSQLCAFSAAMLPLLWRRREKRLFVIGSLLALAALVCFCRLRPVSLEPVEYCEGILSMLEMISPLLMAAGVISLAAVPAFFFIHSLRSRDPRLVSLAMYYAVTMLFSLTGDAPIVFMGVGFSPIAGYFLACVFLLRCHHPANLV